MPSWRNSMQGITVDKSRATIDEPVLQRLPTNWDHGIDAPYLRYYDIRQSFFGTVFKQMVKEFSHFLIARVLNKKTVRVPR